MLIIIKRKEAIKKDLQYYYTGKPCKNGHLDYRDVKKGNCNTCLKNYFKKYFQDNSEKLKDKAKLYQNNIYADPIKKEIFKERQQLWKDNNIDKVRGYTNKFYQTNILTERVRRSAYFKKRREEDPNFKLSKNISSAIYKCLKQTKNNLTWLKFVDYDLATLKDWLENKFKEGMSWENYGSYWHLDHVRPLSWFNLETEFKEAWALNNLQPLEAFLNLSKNNRYEG
jgi:hypothetical protein